MQENDPQPPLEPSEQDQAALANQSHVAQTNQVQKPNKRVRTGDNVDSKAQGAQAMTTSASTNEQMRLMRMAQSFVSESADRAVRQHPELAGALALAAAIDRKADADGLSSAQREIVAARVRQNMVASIERGELPQAHIRQEHEVTRSAVTWSAVPRTAGDDSEYSR